MQHGKVQRSTSYLTRSAANRPLDWLLQDTVPGPCSPDFSDRV